MQLELFVSNGSPAEIMPATFKNIRAISRNITNKEERTRRPQFVSEWNPNSTLFQSKKLGEPMFGVENDDAITLSLRDRLSGSEFEEDIYKGTSCRAEKLIDDLDGRSEDFVKKTTCGCCIGKNVFVRNTDFHRNFEGFFMRSEFVDTPSAIKKYCLDRGQCEKSQFDEKKDIKTQFMKVLKDVGLGEQFEKKKIKDFTGK